MAPSAIKVFTACYHATHDDCLRCRHCASSFGRRPAVFELTLSNPLCHRCRPEEPTWDRRPGRVPSGREGAVDRPKPETRNPEIACGRLTYDDSNAALILGEVQPEAGGKMATSEAWSSTATIGRGDEALPTKTIVDGKPLENCYAVKWDWDETADLVEWDDTTPLLRNETEGSRPSILQPTAVSRRSGRTAARIPVPHMAESLGLMRGYALPRGSTGSSFLARCIGRLSQQMVVPSFNTPATGNGTSVQRPLRRRRGFESLRAPEN